MSWPNARTGSNSKGRPVCHGRAIDIVLADEQRSGEAAVKPAFVRSWYVIRVGRTGATYRGRCCWTPALPG